MLRSILTPSGHAADCRVARAGTTTLSPRNYSMISSATSSTSRDRSSPIALAVLRLMTRRYLLGNSTGRALGFAPRRMRSAKGSRPTVLFGDIGSVLQQTAVLREPRAVEDRRHLLGNRLRDDRLAMDVHEYVRVRTTPPW